MFFFLNWFFNSRSIIRVQFIMCWLWKFLLCFLFALLLLLVMKVFSFFLFACSSIIVGYESFYSFLFARLLFFVMKVWVLFWLWKFHRRYWLTESLCLKPFFSLSILTFAGFKNILKQLLIVADINSHKENRFGDKGKIFEPLYLYYLLCLFFLILLFV